MALNISSQYKRQYTYALIGLATILAIIMLTLSHAAIKDQLNRWKLLPEPEKLTELYFSPLSPLPTVYVPGQSQTVNFTVHNLEDKAVDYKYQIIETSNDSLPNQLIGKGSFVLGQNHYRRSTISVVPVNLGQTVHIIVQLNNVNERIDYIVNRSEE